MFMYIMSAMIAVLAFAFYYIYLKRACMTAGIDISRDLPFKAVILLISACFASYFSEEMGLGAILTLHLVVAALLFGLVNLIVKAATRKTCASGNKSDIIPRGFFAIASKQKHSFNKVWQTIYGSGIVPLVVALAFVVGGYINMNSIVRTDHAVHTDKSLRENGYSIALVSDVHYGVSVDDEELYRICAEISAAKPSIVVLCGDIVDENTTADGMRTVFDAFGSIKSEFGVFYVYGNHDRQLYSDAAVFTESELAQAIEDSGITILRDEVYSVNGELLLVGREDISYRTDGGRKPIKELVSGADADKFIVTLDHQPREYKENADAGVDLILSGHTHGGQIFPMNVLFDIFNANEYNYGHTTVGDCHAIVSSGLAGWGFPVKTAAPAEYVIVSIRNSDLLL